MNTSLLIGILAGTYLNNPKFRQTVDKSIRSVLGQGVDLINGMGGDANVSQEEQSGNRHSESDSQRSDFVYDGADSRT